MKNIVSTSLIRAMSMLMIGLRPIRLESEWRHNYTVEYFCIEFNLKVYTILAIVNLLFNNS